MDYVLFRFADTRRLCDVFVSIPLETRSKVRLVHLTASNVKLNFTHHAIPTADALNLIQGLNLHLLSVDVLHRAEELSTLEPILVRTDGYQELQLRIHSKYLFRSRKASACERWRNSLNSTHNIALSAINFFPEPIGGDGDALYNPKVAKRLDKLPRLKDGVEQSGHLPMNLAVAQDSGALLVARKSSRLDIEARDRRSFVQDYLTARCETILEREIAHPGGVDWALVKETESVFRRLKATKAVIPGSKRARVIRRAAEKQKRTAESEDWRSKR